MNKIFRIVWSEATQSWVAVSELTKAHKKKGSAKNVAAVAAAAIAALGVADGAWAATTNVASNNVYVAAGQGAQANDNYGVAVGGGANAVSESSIAIGSGKDGSTEQGSKAQGHSAIAVGRLAKTNGVNAIAIGVNTQADSDKTIVLGSDSKALSADSIAIGSNAEAVSKYTDEKDRSASVAVGSGAKATGLGSSAFGEGANASAQYTTAIGKSAKADTEEATSVGYSAEATKEWGSALGSKAEATARNTTAVGAHSKATNESATAVGVLSKATSSDTLAVGSAAEASGLNASAVGTGAIASGAHSLAAGRLAKSTGWYSTAIGTEAVASNNGSTSLGMKAQSGWSGTALGRETKATGSHATAVGENATAGGNYSIALGSNSQTLGARTTALGESAIAGDFQGGLAVGSNAHNFGQGSITIGRDAMSGALNQTNFNADNAVTIGDAAKTLGTGAAAVGRNAVATSANSVALGNGAFAGIDKGNALYTNYTNALNAYNVALAQKEAADNMSDPTSDDDATTAETKRQAKQAAQTIATTLVFNATTELQAAFTALRDGSQQNTVAIGNNAQAYQNGSVALGQGSVADRVAIDRNAIQTKDEAVTKDASGQNTNEVYAPVKLLDTEEGINRVKGTVKGNLGAVSVGDKNNTRQIINVAAGSEDSDAVNVAQLKAVVGTIKHYNVKAGNGVTVTPNSQTSPTEWTIAVDENYVKNVNGIKYFSVKSEETGNADNKGATADDAIAIGPNAEVSGKESISIGKGAKTPREGTVAIGLKSNGAGDQSVALGVRSTVGSNNSVALGTSTLTAAERSVAVGNLAHARGGSGVALGNNARGYSTSGIAIGDSSLAGGARSSISSAIAIGNQAFALQNNTISMGSSAYVSNTGDSSISMGNGAQTTRDNAITLGRSSKGFAQNAVTIGSNSLVTGGNSIAIGQGANAGLSADRVDAYTKANNDFVSAEKNYWDKFSQYESAYRSVLLGDDTAARDELLQLVGESELGLADGINYLSTLASSSTSTSAIATIRARALEVQQAKTTLDVAQQAVRNNSATTNSVALGNNASAQGTNTTALGASASAQGTNTTALGTSASARDVRTTAVGYQASALEAGAVGIGDSANAARVRSIAMGTGAQAMSNNAIAIGSSQQNYASPTSAFGKDSIAFGSGALAGVTAEQRTAYTNAVAEYNSAVSAKAAADAMPEATDAQRTAKELAQSQANANLTAKQEALTTAQNAVNNYATAIGRNSVAASDRSIALGDTARVLDKANNSLAIGRDVTVASGAENSIALGMRASTTSTDAIAIGRSATVNNASGVAIGQGAKVSQDNGVALGSNSQTTVGSNVAVFNQNAARTDKYTPTSDNRGLNDSTLAGVSVGNATHIRQINNLAGGTKDTDAVNVAQLKSVNLAFSGNSGTGDVNLHNSTLAVVGAGTTAADKYITTTASGKQISIDVSQKVKDAVKNTETLFDNTITLGGTGAEKTDPQKLSQANGINFDIRGDGTYLTSVASGSAVDVKLTDDAISKLNRTYDVKASGDNVHVDSNTSGDVTTFTVSVDPNKISAGKNVTITGAGTTASPYVIAAADQVEKVQAATGADNLATVTSETNGQANATYTVNVSKAAVTDLAKGSDVHIAAGTYTVGDKTNNANAESGDVSLTYVDGNGTKVDGLAVIKGVAKNDLSNITNNGNTVISNIAKAAVKVVDGTNTKVTEGTSGDAKTYAVNVSGALTGITSITNDKTDDNGKINFQDNGRVEITSTDGNGYPITLNGNTGKITGLQNKTWDPDNITSGQAATEDQLQKALQNTIKLGADSTSTDMQQLSKSGGLQFNIKGTAGYVTTSATGADVTIDLDKAAKDKIDNAAKGWTVQVNDKNGNKQNSQTVQNDTVTFKPGASGNIEIGMADDRTITIETAKNLTADSFTAGNTTINKDGMTVAGGTNGTTTTYGPNGVTIKQGDTVKAALTDGGLNNGGNKITNVANGEGDNDAVNVSQLNALGDNTIQLAGTTGTTDKVKLSKEGGIQFKIEGADDYVTTTAETKDGVNTVKVALADKAKIKYFSVESENDVDNSNNDGAKTEGSIAIGKQAVAGNAANKNNSSDAIAIGTEANALGQYGVAIGRHTAAPSAQTVAIGNEAKTGESWATALGGSANASKQSSVAIGYLSQATEARAVAIGGGFEGSFQTKASGQDSIAIGSNSVASKDRTIAVGFNAAASANDAVALGRQAKAQGSFSTAIGANATVAEGATSGAALGPASSVTQAGGIALGLHSVADTAAGVEGFNAGSADERTNNSADILTGNVLTSTRAAVSVGGGSSQASPTVATRQITDVAAGTANTDAVNVAQLKSVNLGFTGDSGKGDVRLFDQRLSITGDTNFIETEASDKSVKIKAKTTALKENEATGKINAPENDALMKASDVANAINASGFVVTNGATDKGGFIEGNTTANTVVNPGETVKFIAGDNLKVKQAGSEFTYALNPKLENLTSAEFKNGDLTTTINGGGFTISKAGENTANTVSLTHGGLNNGGNTITGVAEGKNGTDAVNVDQLTKATNALKAAERHIAPTTNGNEYTVSNDGKVTLNYVDGDGKPDNTIQAVISDVASKTDVDNLKARNIQLGTNGNNTTAQNLSKDVKFNIKGETNGDIVTEGSGDTVTVKLSDTAKNKLNHTYEVKGDDKGNVTVATDNTTDPNKTTFTVSVKETNLANGTNTTVSGTGTSTDPYKVNVKEALTGITSISNGNNGDKNNGARITLNDGDKNISVNDGKITNVADGTIGEGSKDAINGGQLNTKINELKANELHITPGTYVVGQGNGAAADEVVMTYTNGNGQIVANTTAKIQGVAKSDLSNITNAGKDQITNIAKEASDWFVAVKEEADDATGEKVTGGNTVRFKEGNNIAISRNGHNITIATKDDISAKTVTADTVTINGKDGKDGLSINGAAGKPGVDGKDGTTMTRIVYTDPNNNQHHVATLDDGLKFTGNNTGTENSHKLNTLVKVQGEGVTAENATDDKFKSAAGNINVVANGSDTLTVKLNKNLGNISSISNGGDTGAKITLGGDDNKNIDVNNGKITNVADGEVKDGSKDAVNGGQLYTALSNTVKLGAGTAAAISGTTDAQALNKEKGLQFNIVSGDDKFVTTSASGANVTVNLTDAVKNIINNATNKDLNNLSDDGKKVITGLGSIVKAGTNVDSVETSTNNATGQVTYTVNAKAQVEKVVKAGNKANDENILEYSAEKEGEAGATYTLGVSKSKIEEIAKGATSWKVSVDGKNATDVKNGETVDFIAGNNIAITQDGRNITIATKSDISADKVTVGAKDGADGKDGVDGTIGVNGKDGSAVVINGKDGSIGLNGKDGANGLTIKGADGAAGLDGTTSTRIVYETKDGNKTVTHEVATLDDGMKYAGDDAQGADKSKVIAKKLNQTVDIVGGAAKDKLTTADNIGVNNVDGKLKVQLAKNLDLTDTGSITIGSGNNKVELSQNGLTNGGKAISNVASNLTEAPSATTTSMNAPTNPTTSNAATVGDVLNAGWNLQQNGEAKDFVKPYDTVNFADGTGTTAKVETANGTTSKVTYSVNTGNGLEVTATDATTPANGNKLQVKTDGTTITIKDGAVAANTGGASEVTTAGTEANAPKVGQVKVNDNDSGKLATVDTVVQAVNSAKWFAKAGNDDTVITDADQARDTDAAKEMAAGETLTLKAGKNLRVKQDNGTFTFALDKELKDLDKVVVGEKGADGKPGVDGTIGVNGKDGSAVAINGADGSIGLNGKDGANGLTIKGDKGSVGVDGTNGANGTDGMTRIVYTDGNNTKHEVATLDDGLKFTGNNTTVENKHKLNTLVKVQGELDADKVASFASAKNNINVKADGTDKLEIQLAKNIDLGNDGSVTTGNTTVNNGGVTVKGADGQPTTNYTNNGITITPSAGTGDKVELNNKGLNNGGNTITNVADGNVAKDSKDAVNGGQLYNVSEAAKANRTTVESSDKSITVTDKGDANKHAYDIAVNKQAIVDGAQLPVVYTDAQGNKVFKQADGKFNTKADGSGTEVTADKVIASMNNGSDSSSTPMMLSNVASVVANQTGANYLDKLTAANTATPNAAVNVSDLNAATTALTEKGLNFKAQAGNNIAKKLGETLEIVGAGTGENSDYDATNIKTYTTDDGKLVVAMAKDLKTNSVTTNNVTVGKDGKDGVDGTITVNGKDGSSVVINGKDGSIGLNGKDGANTTISVNNGKDGVNGAPGTKGLDGTITTRIEYKDGDTTRSVATLDDGLKFTGNNTTVENKHKLNTLVKVQGEGVTAENAAEDKFKSAAGNINVVANGTDTLTVKLNKDVNLTESGSVTTGNAKMNNDGVVVQRVASSPIEGDVAYVASVAADKVALQDGLGNNANHKAQLAATGLTVSNKDGSVTTSVTEGLVRVGGTSPTAGGVLIGSQAANFSGNDAKPDVRGNYITGLTNRTWEVGSTEPVFGRAATEDQLKVVSDAAKDAANNAANRNLSNITNDGNKVITALGTVVEAGDRVTVTSTEDQTTGRKTYKVSAAEQVESVSAATLAGDTNLAQVTTLDGTQAGAANAKYAVSVSSKAISDIAKTASAWNVQVNSSDAEKVSGGDTVKFVDGKNITITGSGKNITIATKDKLEATSVTTGDTVMDNNGITIKPTAGSKTVSLTTGGLNNGGNKITNVAAGVNDTDAVNKGQLDKLGNNTVKLGGNTGLTAAQTLNKEGGLQFNIVSGDTKYMTTSANGGTDVTVDLTQDVKNTINNAADKNLSNITEGGKTVISNIAKANDRSIDAKTYNPDSNGTITMTYVDGNGNTITGREAKITGVARSDLTNITDGAKAVIQSLTNVIAGDNAKVTSSTENGVKTYTVSADKQVEQVVAKAGRDNLAVVSVKDGDTAGKANTTYEVNVSEKDVKKAARDAVKVVKADNSPITVASKTEDDTTTYTVGFDGSLAARALPLTYKANGQGDKTVNLDKGLNFTNGTYTTASVADGGVVNFDLNKATADKINNAADNNLSNITNAGNKVITALGSIVEAGDRVTVSSSKDETTGRMTYKVSADKQVESVGLATADKGDENIVTLTLDGKDNAAGTRYNVGVSKAKIQEIARDQAKEASAWFLKDGKETGTGEKISGGDAVVIKNADGNSNITVARSNKTIAIGLASALKDITSIGGNGTTITFNQGGIDLGDRQITGLKSGGNVETNAANIGDVQRISKANERHIKPGEYSVNNNQVTLTYVDGDNKDVAGQVVIKDIAKASEVTGLKSNTIQLGGNSGSTDTQQLSKAGGIKFDIKGAGSGADNHITTQANGSEVTIDLSQSTKDKINNATDKNLSNITNEGKKVITGLGTIVKGDSNVNVSETADATTGQKTYNVSLEPIVVVGDSNKVTINGKSGNIGGLTNKTWSPDNFVSGQAATEDQLKVVYDKFNNIDNDYNKGLTFKAQDGSSVSKKLGDTLDVVGENGITTTVVANGADNKLVVKLSNDLSIGQNGANGTDGRIGVNGKDGSSVVINGKDGSIGLNGANGKNGVTIKGADGAVGVDGKDGTTRIVYTDSDNKPHNLATTDDGMKFGGDQGTPVSRKLNTQVNVKGGATGELTEGNIGVVADGKDTLNVKLAKNVKGVESISKGEGKGGITLKDDGVRIDGGNLDMNNNRVTNLAPGRVAADSKDAVNGAQLHATNQAVINNARNIANLDGKINKVDRDMRAGVAGAMAIGGLYQVTIPGQTMVSAGVGTYKGQSAVAVGYSRLSDNGRIGVKFSVSGNTRGDTGAAASVGYRW